ncbi:MAG: UDP-N-acetylglucosamine 2-epimerase (non-hydrolyzing) [Desulfobacteraceae bacterium]|nr:UDP-N-acetylglucosamine 2-epimerase (non-hydrolyzing) [Desulfobacteraceae bacterium]MBC2718982.1 UDP-N-acetylglucosamine 2-epimerase (non-hydrolyzing) [Desulfobacteraceae bacterium]
MNNKKIRIITVLGARPQFIKASVISRAIQYHNDSCTGLIIEEEIVHTGQHFDYGMSEVFFEKMQIPRPTINLNINSCDHGEMTGEMIIALEKVFRDRNPDWVLVYGDTNSTLSGALAAVKLHIPVAHVEAGLRSFNKRMPEEINRVLTDQISHLLLCPSQQAVDNLLSEGIGKENSTSAAIDSLFDKPPKVVMTGDVMYDSFLFWRKQACDLDIIRDLSLPSSFILATLHRQENTDDAKKLGVLIATMGEVGRKFAPVVMPIHPRTRKLLDEYAIDLPDGILPLSPVSYHQMVSLIDRCQLVITDSGGLQKEAYFAEKCCITLREQTEWVETVDSGTNLIAGSDAEKILSGAESFLSDKRSLSFAPLYGNGNAGRKVVEAILNF